MSLAPLDLVSADTCVTLCLKLVVFEAIVLTDVVGVSASLGEQGMQRVGKDYGVEPVAGTSGVFHPKVSVFSGREASGNPIAMEPV